MKFQNTVHQLLKKFNEGLIEVCEGQALDLYFQDKEIISEDDYLNDT